MTVSILHWVTECRLGQTKEKQLVGRWMDGGGGVVVVSSSSYPGVHQDKDDEQEHFTRYML